MIRHRRPIALLLSLLLLLPAIGCGRESAAGQDQLPLSRTYFLFSTIITIRVFDEGMTEARFDRIGELLETIDQQLSRQLADSEIDQLNRQAGIQPVAVSEETYRVVEEALQFAKKSGGRFNPAIGPLVDLWAIGNGGDSVPSSEQIAEALALIDYEDVALYPQERKIGLARPGMSLDLGAIGKGYAADVIAEYLRSEGMKSALIDLGGNLLTLGAKPDGAPWSIGIQDPAEQRGAYLGTLQVVDKTIVTSGVYERFFKADGQVYHHLLDSATGYPFRNDLLSVSIVTDESIIADGLSTSVFGMGLEEGVAFVEQWDGVDAIFVTEDNQVIVTSGLDGRFQLTHEDYTLAERPTTTP